MLQFKIQVGSVKDVLDFVAIATKRVFPITVGSEKHQVNGKSFMEMFCLNFSRPLKARMVCTEEEYQQFLLDVASLLAI